MKNLTKILIGIIFIMALIFGFTRNSYKNKIDKLNNKVRTSIIAKDSLKELSEGLYTKLVADTLTKRELRHKIDSLQLALKDPKIVTEIKIVIKEIEKPVDGFVVKDSVVTINDTYPNKENPFVNYNASLNLITKKGVGKFKFTPFKIDLAIGRNKDGTYKINSKVPEFMEITSLDVTATPISPAEDKKDNFGILLGPSIGRDFRSKETFFGLGVDMRIHKFYIGVQGNTNGTASGGIKIEF